MSDDVRFEILLSEEALRARVAELAAEIVAALPHGADEPDVVLVGPLKGCVVFMADLARELHRLGLRVALDFLKLSSYGAGTASSGEVVLEHDLSMELAGCHVILLDDIVDTGRTTAFAQRHIAALEPRALTTVMLIDKPERRVVEVEVDHVGFSIPNVFVVGYGLDAAQRYRELPFVGVLEQP